MIVTRFAPSPTGHLHVGHAYSAWCAWRTAVAQAGQFLLRIEDIDSARCKAIFIEAIEQDLRWLGLAWPTPALRQSERLPIYRDALDKLRRLNLLYPCFCTRREVAAEAKGAVTAPHLTGMGPDGPVYPGTCRNLSAMQRKQGLAQGRSPVWRLDMAKACALAGPLTWREAGQGDIKAAPELFGDIVLARKDVPTSYHLSVVVDDHAQGVSLVTRGQDLFSATSVHRLLQQLLGYQAPDYWHHPLLLDENGKRFAKRDRSLTLRALREQGETPQAVLARFVDFALQAPNIS